MKATSLLKKQHGHVRALFRKLEGKNGDHVALVEELADALAAHMTIEQEIFYPAIQKVDEDLLFEALEEHALAEIGLKRLLQTDPGDASFQARVTATRELIEHHVKEEEGQLFPKVEKALDDDTLKVIGKQMQARFEEVEAAGYATVLSDSLAETTSDAALSSLSA